ncbi:bile acid:sodium symporter family protein [Opitutus terrae]|uniref:Bile acid:sodium symporter n=1 Tax=Opitutus terrae (strain DSM 11246 / JCM 15787 / PB90-1) TaxID=452637 RepID=B1ZZ21_OPITP|nr:bile acid:sodium symporter family protein [Opitutus terrae]ACB77093.1 Bile acid:sodium symporter [Opitutus terrae PB90-1]
MRLKVDWFLAGMVAATALAWLFPEPGASGGWLYPDILTKAGIALIFYLHGLALSFGALKAGTLRWPLHVVVQVTTFLVFPLIGLGLITLLGERVSPELRLGLFYLCALPSTVSSSVALTAAAHGNIAAALFNATLSSVLGVFLTPLWVTVVLRSRGAAQPLGPVMLDLTIWLILPLILGQITRPLLGRWAERNKRVINKVDRLTILLLVYTSFCDSFQQGVWSHHGWATLALVLAIAAGLFTLVMAITGGVSRWLGFPREDRIAAMFCGSKKTLASGVPMARLIFGAHPGIGLILLPIMIYHPLQLVICGVLAQRWAHRTEDDDHGHARSTG